MAIGPVPISKQQWQLGCHFLGTMLHVDAQEALIQDKQLPGPQNTWVILEEAASKEVERPFFPRVRPRGIRYLSEKSL